MPRVLILGVNPFEDLPGYHLLSLLKSGGEYDVVAADDSAPALAILAGIGTKIRPLPHPSDDPQRFTDLVARLCVDEDVDVILPGTDAHLYALTACLSRHPRLASICPTLQWLADMRLFNKPDLQRWAAQAGMTPDRWSFDDERDARRFKEESRYPIMVKGFRKGAVKCDDELEAVIARRVILRNPANQGPGGGVYAERFVDGEEHSLFLLSGARGSNLMTFGFRKLAMTQLGTTVAGQVSREKPEGVVLDAILTDLTGPTVLELEWRRDSSGRAWLFEVNVRFPSWIGALGAYGRSLVGDYIDRTLGRSPEDRRTTVPPAHGSIFYRLPQSGFLPLESVFGARFADWPFIPTIAERDAKPPLLWKSASPHQFLVK